VGLLDCLQLLLTLLLGVVQLLLQLQEECTVPETAQTSVLRISCCMSQHCPLTNELASYHCYIHPCIHIAAKGIKLLRIT
jgi:hypothetical protein